MFIWGKKEQSKRYLGPINLKGNSVLEILRDHDCYKARDL